MKHAQLPQNEQVPVSTYPLDSNTYGQPRIKAGPDGRAVHLSVLVRWLMDRHESTRVEAVRDRLLPILRADAPPILYFARPGGNAQPVVTALEWFASGDGGGGDRRTFSRGIDSKQAVLKAPPTTLGRGVAGAADWLSGMWGDPKHPDSVMEHIQTPGAWLMVSEADAIAHWDYGHVVGEQPNGDDQDDPVPALAPSRPIGKRWKPEEVAEVRRQFYQDGGWRQKADGRYIKDSKLQTQLAKKLGLSNRSSLDRILEESPKPGEFALHGVATALTKAAR